MSESPKYTLKWLFFEFSVRIRRMTYMLSGVFFVALYSYLLIQIVQTPEHSPAFGILGLIFLALMLVSLWATVALSVKRLHDIGYTGYLAILMFVPMASFLFFLALCFFKGQPGPNQYGDSPVVATS